MSRKKAKVRMLNGYKVVYMPEHPNSMKSDNWHGYIYEHIAVAEKMIGRNLRKKEEVHHLNFNKQDNREKNLLVLEKSMHSKLHNWLNNGAPGYESSRENRVNSRKSKEENHSCLICSKALTKDAKEYCSFECRGISHRKVKRPSKSELKSLIENNTWTAIGKMYGVSCNAVRKWARKYELL